MTPYVDCVFAQKHLEAFVDRELPVNDEILVESHLRWCTTCAARVEDLQTIGLVVRSRTRREPRRLPNDRDLTAMRSELLRVADAERDRSLDARLRELGRRCADLRFVWPALGASAAVALCVGLAETMWRATAEQQPASLAAMIESMADPGSDRNPLRLDGAMLVPRVLHNQGAVAHAVLDSDGSENDDEVYAVAAVVTREGKVGTYELLQASTAAAGQRGHGRPRRRGRGRSAGCGASVALRAGARPGRPHGGRERRVAVRQDDGQGLGDDHRSRPTVVGAGSNAPCRRSAKPGAAAGRAERTPVGCRRSVSDGLIRPPAARRPGRWRCCSARRRLAAPHRGC